MASAKTILTYGAMALLILLTSIVCDNKKTQGWHMTVPYFSGAANYKWGQGWLHDETAITPFNQLPSREAREAYRFQPSDNLTRYDFQAKGYLYVALVARTIFFWQGDLKAVEFLQVLTHILITLFIVSRLTPRRSQVLFFLLYGLNPLIHYIATYPYYYYWQTIPTALIALYLLNKDFKFGLCAPLVAASAAFSFQVRPSTLFASVFLIGLLARRESRLVVASSLIALVASALILFEGSVRQNPWHTAYVGIGAYPNPYVEEFTDKPSMNLYEKHTGVPLVQSLGGNYYEKEVAEEFRRIGRQEYFTILRKSPFMIVRNAVLNFFQSFSLGYFTLSLLLSYLSSLAGFVFVAVLLWRGRYGFAVAIALNSLSFVPYYPPIPAYMFGAYILLVGAFVDLMNDLPMVER